MNTHKYSSVLSTLGDSVQRVEILREITEWLNSNISEYFWEIPSIAKGYAWRAYMMCRRNGLDCKYVEVSGKPAIIVRSYVWLAIVPIGGRYRLAMMPSILSENEVVTVLARLAAQT